MLQRLKNKKVITIFSILLFFIVAIFYFTNPIFKNNKTIAVNAADCPATGGTVTQVNGYCIHTFTSSGTFVPSTITSVEYLVVAGGGGGGGTYGSGGGGAGGLLTNVGGAGLAVSGSVSVFVGAGGAASTTANYNNGYGFSGGNSSFGSIVATGGGGGAYMNVGVTGGSGGGSSRVGASRSSGTSGQGNGGGAGYDSPSYASGGGGGAGGTGADGSSTKGGSAGAGGAGLQNSITGSSVYYAAGGGAGGDYFDGRSTAALGGSGIGGNGATGTVAAGNGVANTGSGGGGAGQTTSGTSVAGGNGGSGVVIVRYPLPTNCLATGGTITELNGYCIHTFTSSGTFVPSSNMGVEVLVVAGGGAGGYTAVGSCGGGGGAGGLIYNPAFAVTPTSYTVTVGAGGAQNTATPYGTGASGGDSYFGSMKAFGGGGGAGYQGLNGGYSYGANGGSGGGSENNAAVSTSTQTSNNGGTGYGNAGGAGALNPAYNAGGGGGAGSAGYSGATTVGGAGGAGKYYNISGVNTAYAGGGGGGIYSGGTSGGAGGVGGGGSGGDINGSSGIAGAANTGGGGGGRGRYNVGSGVGGAGGSGIVIVRYPIPVTLFYSRPVVINNTSNTSTLNSYQILTTVDTASLITAGKLQSDCDDLRFTNNSTSYNTGDWTNNYPYWIESGCNTTTTKIWIKVDSIAASANKTIYMYYGNSSAEAFSNGDDAFDFFDDFNGTSLDTNKWREAVTGGSHSYVFSNSVVAMTSVSTTDYSYMDTTKIFGTNYSLKVRANIDATGTDQTKQKNVWWNAVGDSPDKYFGFAAGYPYAGAMGIRAQESSEIQTTLSNVYSGYHTYEVIRNGTISGMCNIDGATVRTETAQVLTGGNRLTLGSYGSGMVTYVDWALVRQYTSPEPTTTIGTEESSSAVLTQVTPVSTPTSDTTPNYVFSSDKTGIITYGGDCSSATTAAVVGNNTITFNTLAAGTHSNCTIAVGASNVLTVPSFIITSFTTYTSPNMSCTLTTEACTGTNEAIIFKLYDPTGNHAELSNQTNYSYKVCCTGEGLSNSCAATMKDTVLKLSDVTNAHAEKKTLTSYANDVCLSSTTMGVTCGYSTSTSCSDLGTNYVCLASISADTNAHIGDCTAYPIKACCKVAVLVDPCTAKVAANKFVSSKDTDIQLCSGADVTNTSDPCYSVCWKGTGAPVITSSSWKCGVCHNSSNVPVSCSTLGSTTFNWIVPTGYTTPTNYTLIGETTLTSPNPIIRFVTTDSTRQMGLTVNTYGVTCSSSSVVQLMPKWKEISPFK